MVFLVILLDVVAIAVAVCVARALRRPYRPSARANWRPSDNDARSGRRIRFSGRS